MPNTVIVTREEPIAVVQINRPEVRNALNDEVMSELVAATRRLDDDEAIRCIIITGDDKAFCAGADIKEEFVKATPVSMLARDLTSQWEALRKIRTPLVAAVSGYALGGGCELAMICDVIVASETARFGQPEINLGIIPGAGGTQRLTRTVGKYVANEIILTGRFVNAAEAEAMGLAAQVYPAASWLDDAKTLARTIAEKPPVAARLATEAVDLALNSTPDARLEFEREAFYLLSAGQDLDARLGTIEKGGDLRLGDELRRRSPPVIATIRTMRKPVVAAVNGVAAGAGLGLAVACDVRVAAASASFRAAWGRVGLVPDAGSAFFLPRLLGWGRALDMVLTGDPVSADAALSYGLATRVWPDDQFAAKWREDAQTPAPGATQAVALTQEGVNAAMARGFSEILEIEAALQDPAGPTAGYAPWGEGCVAP